MELEEIVEKLSNEYRNKRGLDEKESRKLSVFLHHSLFALRDVYRSKFELLVADWEKMENIVFRFLDTYLDDILDLSSDDILTFPALYPGYQSNHISKKLKRLTEIFMRYINECIKELREVKKD